MPCHGEIYKFVVRAVDHNANIFVEANGIEIVNGSLVFWIDNFSEVYKPRIPVLILSPGSWRSVAYTDKDGVIPYVKY